MEKPGEEKLRILPRPVRRFRWIRGHLSRFDRFSMIGAVRFRFPVMTRFLKILTVTGQGSSWGIAVVVLWAGSYTGLIHFPMQWRYLNALLAPGFAWIIVKALKSFWRRPRPFQSITDYLPLTHAPTDESFPSGHSASVFAFLVAILPFAAPAVVPVVAVWAVLVAGSRWYLGVHYPTDIFVGATVGAVVGAAHAGVFDYLSQTIPTWPPL